MKHKTFRGGSWNDDPVFCRSAVRDRFGPGTWNLTVGLRVVLVEEKKNET